MVQGIEQETGTTAFCDVRKKIRTKAEQRRPLLVQARVAVRPPPKVVPMPSLWKPKG